MTETKVTLIIKSTVQQNFTLQVSPVDTLGLIQQRLSAEYFGNPREIDQTVSVGELVTQPKDTYPPSGLSLTHHLVLHQPRYSQLIYAGKVLKDKSVKIQDLVGQVRDPCLSSVQDSWQESGFLSCHPSLHSRKKETSRSGSFRVSTPVLAPKGYCPTYITDCKPQHSKSLS